MKRKAKYLFFLCLAFGLSACHQETSNSKKADQVVVSDEFASGTKADRADSTCLEDSRKYLPSSFSALLKKLNQAPFQYALQSLDTISTKETLLFQGLQRANARLQYQGKKSLAPLNPEGLLGIQKALVKGTVPISPNTFPRASIEEWEFRSSNCIKNVLTYLEVIKDQSSWDIISKSPMDYWQQENRLYFLVPGGFYMLEEAKAIQKTLRKNND